MCEAVGAPAAAEPGGDTGSSLAGSHPGFAGLTAGEKGGRSA